MLVATAVSMAMLLGVPACGEDPPSGPTGPTPVETPATVTGLEIRSPAAFADDGHRLAVGDTISLTACARYSNNNETCDVSATWSSSAPDVATVNSDGSLTGVAPGEARISAVFERQSAALTVEVESRPEDPVTATGLTIRGPRRLQVDETVSLTACARYNDDTEACDIGATWSSGATDVATVDNEGNVTGITPGEAPISATFASQNATVTLTVEHRPAAGTWRGLTIAAEDRCSPYNAEDYRYPQSVEDDVVRELGGIYSPYTCESFDSTRETDIEHMVARSEAHDSGLCAADASTRTRFSRDLINLTLSSPAVNRQQKGASDAAEWLPDQNRCWFAQTIIDVRLAYDLTIDQREADALDRTLAGCTSTTVSCDLTSEPETETTRHPPVQSYRNCTSMREAGWTRGVNRNGGTYQDAWDDTERRTYNLNTARDRDNDGHACE